MAAWPGARARRSLRIAAPGSPQEVRHGRPILRSVRLHARVPHLAARHPRTPRHGRTAGAEPGDRHPRRPASAQQARKRRRNKRHDRCQREGATCDTADVCCSGTCDFLVKDGSCAPCRGRSCSTEHPCCGSLDCVNGFCDGCRDRATSCTTDAQCCFSDCTSGACLSAAGRTLRTRRRLPLLLPQPRLHQRLRQRILRGVSAATPRNVSVRREEQSRAP